jgi:hypothetical protein
LLLSVAAVCGVGVVSSTAQSTKEEREIETRIATHLPIKVKIKKPDKVKDLKNEEWIDDLEIEATNTGTKPIYYLYIAFLLPDDVMVETGKGLIYQLRYGRIQLSDFNEPVRSDDMPILPGESAVLKVSDLSAKSWKALKAGGKVANPKKLRFWFQLLNHGDGTGFMGPDGLRLPNVSCQEEDKRGALTSLDINF